MIRKTTITFLIASFIAVSHGHYSGRIRNNVNPLHNMHRDLSLSCSCDDLNTLVTLVRALMEDKECGSAAGHTPSGSICNAEDLIMNLVNALIQLTTQALSHNCHCPSQNGNNNPGNGGSGNNHPHYNDGSGNNHPHYNGGSGNNNPHYNGGSGNNNPHYNGGSGYSHSDQGLLDIDLLNHKKDNVLDLDLARQHLLGVGLGGGGGNSQGSDGYYNKYNRNANGGNDEGLVNVDILNQKKTGNVADVGVGNQHVAGIGLGGGSNASASSQSSTNTKSMTGSSGNKSNNGDGIVNVDLLNHKHNDLVDVNAVGQTVLGIGVGNNK